MIFPAPLLTERLTIAAPDPAAAAQVNAAVRESFPELHRWMPWADHIPTLEETRAFLESAQDALLLWDRASGAFVGASGLHPRPADAARREIGYWIRTPLAGRGYATEAVRAIARCAFEQLGLAGLEIRCSARNVASQRVALAAGFARRAVLTDGRTDPDGEPSSTWVYVLERGGGSGQ